MNQRETALDILHKTISKESYSNLLMRKELEKFPVQQRAFITNLVNGVLRNYEFLHFQIEDEIKKSTSLKTRLILIMALYERFVLKEKDYVVNNEYVDLASNKYEKSFINALLHKIKKLKECDDEAKRNNLPEWIYRLLKSQYNEEELEQIINVYRSIPEVYYRLNKAKADFKDFEDHDIEITNDDIFTSRKNLLNTDSYKDGLFYIQDLNSSSLYRHLDLKQDDVLLDVCSAPGSKLFNCLDIVKPVNAYSNDIRKNRVVLIEKMAHKLGFNSVHYLNYDGREIKDNIDVKFDKILLDAPCSGLGVIGRKPDLKFHIKPESLDELQLLQYELLESMDQLLKDNGLILYSTCTLNKKENERLVKKFIDNNPKYRLEEDETIINDKGDCFYYAKIRKVNS